MLNSSFAVSCGIALNNGCFLSLGVVQGEDGLSRVSLKPSRRYAVGYRTSTDQEALRVEDFPERVGRPLETANKVRIRLLGEGEVRFQKGLEDCDTNPFRTRNGQ